MGSLLESSNGLVCDRAKAAIDDNMPAMLVKSRLERLNHSTLSAELKGGHNRLGCAGLTKSVESVKVTEEYIRVNLVNGSPLMHYRRRPRGRHARVALIAGRIGKPELVTTKTVTAAFLGKRNISINERLKAKLGLNALEPCQCPRGIV